MRILHGDDEPVTLSQGNLQRGIQPDQPVHMASMHVLDKLQHQTGFPNKLLSDHSQTDDEFQLHQRESPINVVNRLQGDNLQAGDVPHLFRFPHKSSTEHAQFENIDDNDRNVNDDGNNGKYDLYDMDDEGDQDDDNDDLKDPDDNEVIEDNYQKVNSHQENSYQKVICTLKSIIYFTYCLI